MVWNLYEAAFAKRKPCHRVFTPWVLFDGVENSSGKRTIGSGCWGKAIESEIMPRTCTVCGHKERQAIDKALVAGESFRNISQHFGRSAAALFRHKEHVTGALVKAAERREERHGASLLDQVEDLTAESQGLLSRVLQTLFPPGSQNGEKQAVSPKDAKDASAVVRDVRENLRFIAQLTGQLKGDGATVNIGIGILASPEWGRISSAVLGALPPYPDARAAVADALARLSGDTAPGTRAEKLCSLLGKSSPSLSGVPIVSSGESPP